MDKFALLDPKIDIVFKAIFGCSVHSKPLLSLVNSILQAFGEPEASGIIVLNPVLNLEHLNDKGAILDIRAELEWEGLLASDAKRNQLNVELQALNQRNWPERSVYYWSRLYGGQLDKGGCYQQLQQTISISLLDFKLFDRSRMYSLYELRERVDHEPLSSLLQMYFVELPKWGEVSTVALDREFNVMSHKESSEVGEPIPAHLAEWVQFLNVKSEKDLDRLPKDNEALQEASEILLKMSWNPWVRELYEARRRARMDYEDNIEGAKEEGIQIGMEKGMEKGKAELLLSLGTDKYGKLPAWVENKLKNASPEQIAKWSRAFAQTESLEAWINRLQSEDK